MGSVLVCLWWVCLFVVGPFVCGGSVEVLFLFSVLMG